MAIVRMFRDLDEGGVSGSSDSERKKAIALGCFEDPCCNFSPIGYEERLQMFHLVYFSQLQFGRLQTL